MKTSCLARWLSPHRIGGTWWTPPMLKLQIIVLPLKPATNHLPLTWADGAFPPLFCTKVHTLIPVIAFFWLRVRRKTERCGCCDSVRSQTGWVRDRGKKHENGRFNHIYGEDAAIFLVDGGGNSFYFGIFCVIGCLCPDSEFLDDLPSVEKFIGNFRLNFRLELLGIWFSRMNPHCDSLELELEVRRTNFFYWIVMFIGNDELGLRSRNRGSRNAYDMMSLELRMVLEANCELKGEGGVDVSPPISKMVMEREQLGENPPTPLPRVAPSHTPTYL